jgi:hypothetical protein
MKSPDDLLRVAVGVLGKSEPESAVAPPPSPAMLSAMRGALRERARKKKQVRWLVPLVAFAAAAAAAVAVASSYAWRPGATLAFAPAKAAVVASAHLAQPVITTDQGTIMSLASGAHVELDRDSDFGVMAEGATQIIHLTSGVVRAKVHGLVAGARFLVRVDDVEVEAEDAVFRVERCAHAGCEFSMKVAVESGAVVIRQRGGERRVAAPESFALPPPAPAKEPAVIPSKGAAASSKHEAVSASELAAQNQLFYEAMEAKSRGDLPRAITDLDTFLHRYPRSPLAEGAAAQRMRLLAKTHDPRATDAARDYLARHPAGFGRRDAEAIIGEAPQK